jgi:hypothetical protein
MSQDNNVIQFPGKKREAGEGHEPKPRVTDPSTPPPVPAAPTPKSKTQKATVAGSVLAIAMAVGAFNHMTFDSAAKMQSLEASSYSGNARTIASVSNDGMPLQRDAGWEKDLAESLASANTRAVASTHLGRPASLEERLRYGTLDDTKYTILKADNASIQSITLQGEGVEPNYVTDRAKFLREYGPLLKNSFASARLKSVEVGTDKTIEQYTLFDKDQRPTGEAHFELDRFKRLRSLTVEPVQI